MNAFIWFIALVASIALTYLFFTEYTGATFVMIGWMCGGLILFCIVMTVVSMFDDSRDEHSRFGF